jgi:hypothetical protein
MGTTVNPAAFSLRVTLRKIVLGKIAIGHDPYLARAFETLQLLPDLLKKIAANDDGVTSRAEVDMNGVRGLINSRTCHQVSRSVWTQG